MGSADVFNSTGRVVRLFGKIDTAQSDRIEKIEAYWQGLRAGRLVPTRAELDPRALRGVLGHAFILERLTGGLGRFRIAGAHLTEALGMDVRGMPISALFEPDARERLTEAVAEVFDGPSIARLSIRSRGGFGRGALTGSMVLLPLRSDLGDITRILGAVELNGRVGRTPRRLSLDSVEGKGLTGRGEPAPEDHAGGRPLHGTAEAAKPTPAKEGHLRLVIDNT